MNAKEVLRAALDQNRWVVMTYLNDLSDADLLLRPAPSANHIAWQLGHLIGAECSFMKQCGGTPPELPAGFTDLHGKEGTSKNQGFLTKAQYLDLLKRTREATLAALDKLSEADLDKPSSGNIAKFAPTLGKLLVLIAGHELMHGGQFVVVRRQLGKPVVF